MMRVTDLDKFSLEEIWRPYQSLAGHEDRLSHAPHSLAITAEIVRQDSEWSRAVLGRLRSMGVWFPDYIKHPLVDVVRCGTLSPLSPEKP